MRLRFSPRKRERKIFMGTLLPEEKKVRDMIENIVYDEDSYFDVRHDSSIALRMVKNIYRNEAGL